MPVIGSVWLELDLPTVRLKADTTALCKPLQARAQLTEGILSSAFTRSAEQRKSHTFASWNQIAGWLQQFDGFREGGVTRRDGATEIP
jgi:hypothetical protein